MYYWKPLEAIHSVTCHIDDALREAKFLPHDTHGQAEKILVLTAEITTRRLRDLCETFSPGRKLLEKAVETRKPEILPRHRSNPMWSLLMNSNRHASDNRSNRCR